MLTWGFCIKKRLALNNQSNIIRQNTYNCFPIIILCRYIYQNGKKIGLRGLKAGRRGVYRQHPKSMWNSCMTTSIVNDHNRVWVPQTTYFSISTSYQHSQSRHICIMHYIHWLLTKWTKKRNLTEGPILILKTSEFLILFSRFLRKPNFS